MMSTSYYNLSKSMIFLNLKQTYYIILKNIYFSIYHYYNEYIVKNNKKKLMYKKCISQINILKWQLIEHMARCINERRTHKTLKYYSRDY